MTAFVALWLFVAAYQVFEVVRGVRSLLMNPGATVSFHWSFIMLALLNGLLGGLYMVGVVR